MKVILQAPLFQMFKKPDFTNKSTGEVIKGKYTLQLMHRQKLSNKEEKSSLVDVTIPDEKASLYKDKVGKDVNVEVGVMVSDNGKVIYYGL